VSGAGEAEKRVSSALYRGKKQYDPTKQRAYCGGGWKKKKSGKKEVRAVRKNVLPSIENGIDTNNEAVIRSNAKDRKDQADV